MTTDALRFDLLALHGATRPATLTADTARKIAFDMEGDVQLVVGGVRLRQLYAHRLVWGKVDMSGPFPMSEWCQILSSHYADLAREESTTSDLESVVLGPFWLRFARKHERVKVTVKKRERIGIYPNDEDYGELPTATLSYADVVTAGREFEERLKDLVVAGLGDDLAPAVLKSLGSYIVESTDG